MTSTYNPKFKHVPRSELKVGEIYVCGDEEHEASPCWRLNGKVSPLKVTRIDSSRCYVGVLNKKKYCDCDDLDHLYLYEPMETNNEITWADLKAGDRVEHGSFVRVVLARINDLVFLSRAEKSDDAYWKTTVGIYGHIEELKREHWSIVQPPKKLTREQVLASLTPEEREALGE